MRTTLDIDPDVLATAKQLAARRNVSVGRVLSDLARQALTDGRSVLQTCEPAGAFFGFQPFPARGVVDNDTIDGLRARDGA